MMDVVLRLWNDEISQNLVWGTIILGPQSSILQKSRKRLSYAISRKCCENLNIRPGWCWSCFKGCLFAWPPSPLLEYHRHGWCHYLGKQVLEMFWWWENQIDCCFDWLDNSSMGERLMDNPREGIRYCNVLWFSYFSPKRSPGSQLLVNFAMSSFSRSVQLLVGWQ